MVFASRRLYVAFSAIFRVTSLNQKVNSTSTRVVTHLSGSSTWIKHYTTMAQPVPAAVPVADNLFEVIKSCEDKSQYKGIVLDNGMKVLLVSDPTADKAAAALDIHVGHMCDPKDLPGLAHFCEHMLFLGTQKYPAENEYNKFLSQNGGSSNAFTGAEHTNYYFDVLPEHLQGALDRFAQFFLCPLFTESTTSREVNAVNSEHEKNIQNDIWRINQLEKSTCDPTHDYSKFGTGNKETLDSIPKSKGINIRDELLKFHDKFYSSNIMALSVLGRETLEELSEMVMNLFSEVKDKNVSIPEWTQHPVCPEHLKSRYYVLPVQDTRILHVTFPIPDLHPHYKANPGHYLGHLIGHEGPGSLLSELKARGWVNNLVGGYKSGAKGFAFFIVRMVLTEDGIENVDETILLLFQYLNMMKEEGIQQWVFEECKNLASMTFRFKDRERPQMYTCGIAGMLHDYPLDEVLCGPYLLHNYEPDLIRDLLSRLTPENIQVAVIAKKFENIVDTEEKWYGTKYKLEPIPDSVLESWSTCTRHSALKLPPKNEFIPTNFDILPKETDSAGLPTLIKNTELCRVWFKQDDEFNLPKSVLIFEFESPLAYLDPLHCNMAYMFVQLFKDALNEYTYAAELAGLSYSLNNTKYGMFLSVKGYNDKQHILLQKIFEKMTTFQIDRKRFDILKEAYVRTLKNFHTEQPHQHATYYIALLLAERAWSNEELLEATEELTMERVQELIPQMLSRMHVEALVHGNITKQRALSLMSVIETKMEENVSWRPLLPSQMVRFREYQLVSDYQYMFQETNTIHRSSSIEAYYQCGLQETRANMILELFSQLIKEPCYNVLRTQEQLGYIVCSGVRRGNGVQGVRVIVQSDRSPSYVDTRIEAFLDYVGYYLAEMSETDFNAHKGTLAAKRLERPKKLFLLSAKYWLEIASQQYNFDRDRIEVDCLNNLTKDDILNFYRDTIAADGPFRKKLCVHIVSTADNNLVENGEVDGLNPTPPMPPQRATPILINNITEYKRGLALYPLVKPCIIIPPPVVLHPKSPAKSRL